MIKSKETVFFQGSSKEQCCGVGKMRDFMEETNGGYWVLFCNVNFYCIFIKSIQLVLGKLGRKQILLFTPL
jgi:hypothetical protein